MTTREKQKEKRRHAVTIGLCGECCARPLFGSTKRCKECLERVNGARVKTCAGYPNCDALIRETSKWCRSCAGRNANRALVRKKRTRKIDDAALCWDELDGIL